MGKSKSSRRRKNRRHNPVAGGSSEKVNKPKETDPGSSVVLESILEQITSGDDTTRDNGLTGISIMASQKQHLAVLKNPSLLKTVVPLLMDSNLQNAAAGTLRNLSCVDEELCGMLMEENVMEKIVEVIKETFANWTPTATTSHPKDEGTILQCVALLWNLCENTSSAVQIATHNNLHNSLTRYLDWTIFGLNLSTTVAHCLYTLSEDNSNLNHTQQLTQVLIILLQAPSTPPQLSTPVLGILLNISSNDHSKLPSSTQESFIPLLAKALVPDFVDMIKKLTSDLPIDISEFNASHEKATEDIIIILTTAKTSLEILSNVVCLDDDACASSSDDEPMDCDDDDSSSSNDNVATASTLPLNLYTSLTTHLPALLPLLLDACRPIPTNVYQMLLSNKLTRLINNFTQVRITSLIALQNLFESLPLEVLENDLCTPTTREILNELLKLVQNVHAFETDILESVTSCMRSLLTLCSTDKTKKQAEDAPNIVPEPFFELYQHNDIAKIRINAIKILGSVCILSSTANNYLFLLKETGLFMKQIIIPPVSKTNLLIVVELLDTLMDIFAEDETDGVLKEIGLLGRLGSLSGEIKKVARMERRSLAVEQKAVVETVLDNLPRFVEYKGKILVNKAL